jgi:Smg protein
MKESVLDVLIYLFENYMFDDDGYGPDQETLMIELSQAGFEHLMIDRAFEWLENLALLCEQHPEEMSITSHPSIRHYTAEEREHLDIAARGLILNLEQCGVLSPVSREMVIDQLMALGAEQVELDHIKWVILMVLSNFTDGEGISELTESLVMDGLHGCIH